MGIVTPGVTPGPTIKSKMMSKRLDGLEDDVMSIHTVPDTSILDTVCGGSGEKREPVSLWQCRKCALHNYDHSLHCMRVSVSVASGDVSGGTETNQTIGILLFESVFDVILSIGIFLYFYISKLNRVCLGILDVHNYRLYLFDCFTLYSFPAIKCESEWSGCFLFDVEWYIE